MTVRRLLIAVLFFLRASLPAAPEGLYPDRSPRAKVSQVVGTAEVTVDTELPQAARLVVDILDLQGGVVRGLYAGERPAGAHRLQWDAADDRGARVAPGTYLVRLATPYGSSTKPVVIQ